MSRECVPRSDGPAYVGLRRYFLTICTFHRTHTFRKDPLVESLLMQLRQRAIDHRFAIHAYCFMPHHVHLLLEGLSHSLEFRRFVRDWKQRTTFEYRSTTGGDLWERGHLDHVLRPDEDTYFVMRYVLRTPVRAGLVAHVKEYRYVDSDTSAIDAVLSRVAEYGDPRAHARIYSLVRGAHETPSTDGEPLATQALDHRGREREATLARDRGWVRAVPRPIVQRRETDATL